MTARTRRAVAGAILLAALCCGPAAAYNGRRDMRGVGVGMSAEQIIAKAKVPCRLNKAGNLSCIDPSDGSEFKVLLSGGKPPVALSVKHTFCSPATPAQVLAGLRKSFGLPGSAVHPNPNGFTLDMTDTVQGILVPDGGPCTQGRRSYEVTLRDAALMRMPDAPAGTGSTKGLSDP